jgi:peroxiredoxin
MKLGPMRLIIPMRPLIGLALLCLTSIAHAEELAEVGKVGPAFRLPVYNAQGAVSTTSLDAFVGPAAKDKKTKLLIVSFMASFCAPCKKEMPALQALFDAYQSKGLRVMLVSIDSEAEGQKKIEELISQNKITFPVAKDRFNLVARRWLGTKSPLPSLFILKPDGTVATLHRGYSEDGAQLLKKEIESALGKP